MTDRETENRIRASYKGIAPDALEAILCDCDEQKGKVITMRKKKNKSSLKAIASAAAALVLVAGGILGVNAYKGNHTVDSTILLDVNPSIEIETNKKEKVLAVNPLNDDAKEVIGEMDFAGSSLEVTLNALIGSLLRNGYISDTANSILVTVDHSDLEAGVAMEERLISEISSILESGNVSGAVLGQTVSGDEEIQTLADQYGITVGKAALIRQITLQNAMYTFEDLVPLTIHELNLISESGVTKLENVQSVGTASDAAYIGEEAAKSAAFSHAGVDAQNAVRVKCELDWEDGIMVYEVDFDADGFEYEYEIHAETGAVVRFEKEADVDHEAVTVTEPEAPVETEAPTETPAETVTETDEPTVTPTEEPTVKNTYVGEAAAKAAALKHAGVKESEIRDYSCEIDHEHGIVVYEIDFDANGYEYEYEIHAVTGAVYRYSRDKDDDIVEKTAAPVKTPEPTATPTAAEASGIDAATAKSIALNHAGVTGVTDYECELERENGKQIYEISFTSGGYEYEYEISAADGSILKHEKEKDDDIAETTPAAVKTTPRPTVEPTAAATVTEASGIDAATAKSIALNHAGVTKVTDYECELERENGKQIYEISFTSGGYEYEYEISAADGSILKHEKEKD